MKFKKEDVLHHLVQPDYTYIELKDGTQIHNKRQNISYLIINKNGKRRYQRKQTPTRQDITTFGKMVEALGMNIKKE